MLLFVQEAVSQSHVIGALPQMEQTSVFQSLIFWSLLSFAVLFWLLKRYAFPPILEVLEAREKRIRGDLQNAENLKEEAARLKEDFENQLKTAHEKSTTIVQMASDEAKRIQEKTLQETQAKVNQVKRDAEHEVQMSRNKLLSEIRNYSAALTIASTERFLKKAMDDQDKKRLVNESIEEVIQELEKSQKN